MSDFDHCGKETPMLVVVEEGRILQGMLKTLELDVALDYIVYSGGKFPTCSP